MFDSLIDNVDPDKWQEVDMSCKVEGEWVEYQVNRHCKQKDDKTICFQVAPSSGDGDPTTVDLCDCLPKKNPLKEIHVIELRINDAKEITGIDLNGDVIVRK